MVYIFYNFELLINTHKWLSHKISRSEVKVLVGSDVSYRQPEVVPNFVNKPPIPDVREKDQYFDVAKIKPSPDSHFCILTLEQSVELVPNVGPLCLPEINKPQTVFEGTVLGLGYNEGFQDEVKSWPRKTTSGRREERRMTKHSMQLYTNCKAVGGGAHNTWALKRKWIDNDNDQTTPDEMEYFWIERYEKQRNT